jgi:LmbE family N-acetylglucosaminyl deacetylase
MNTIAETLVWFQTRPQAAIADILQGETALILAPHADDESLGCGGLIAAACAAHLPPVVVVMTDGAASHPGSHSHPPARLAALREAEARHAVSLLGLPPSNLSFLRYPDTALPKSGAGFAEAVTRIQHIAATHSCRLLIAPWQADPHCDHEAAAAIAAAAAANSRLRLLSYPVWGWLRDPTHRITQPRRGWQLDITAQLPAKQRAIAAHRSQYGGLITESPTGFRLPATLLQIFARPFEVFLE